MVEAVREPQDHKVSDHSVFRLQVPSRGRRVETQEVGRPCNNQPELNGTRAWSHCCPKYLCDTGCASMFGGFWSLMLS